MTDKVIKLAKGAAFGIVAGVFAVFALIYLGEALAWAINDLLDVETAIWAGFLITGVLILLLGAIAGLIAVRLIKKGSPPKPALAIEEAQLIRGTLTVAARRPRRRPDRGPPGAHPRPEGELDGRQPDAGGDPPLDRGQPRRPRARRGEAARGGDRGHRLAQAGPQAPQEPADRRGRGRAS